MDPYRGGAIPGSPGPCPRCPDLDLEPKDTGELTVAACRQCHGLWLEGSRMVDLYLASEKELERLARLDERPRRDPGGDATCPRCRTVMKREVGAVIDYDVCAAHGLWFDEGELRALLAHAGVDGSSAASPPPASRARQILDGLGDYFFRNILGSSLPKK